MKARALGTVLQLSVNASFRDCYDNCGARLTPEAPVDDSGNLRVPSLGCHGAS